MCKKMIIIDTEEYAGNFEREMVAFITAQTGECGVGEEAAAIARAELPPKVLKWFDANVVQVPDEHGCSRPASIVPTPGWYNNGTGSHRRLKSAETQPKYPAYLSVALVVDEWPPDAVMEVITSRAKEFCQRFYPEHSMLSRFSGDSFARDVVIPFVGIRWVESVVTTTTIKRYE